jgi:hypothetical protein
MNVSAIPLSSQQFPGFYHSLLHSWFKVSPSSTFSAMSWMGLWPGILLVPLEPDGRSLLDVEPLPRL